MEKTILRLEVHYEVKRQFRGVLSWGRLEKAIQKVDRSFLSYYHLLEEWRVDHLIDTHFIGFLSEDRIFLFGYVDLLLKRWIFFVLLLELIVLEFSHGVFLIGIYNYQ